MFLLSQRTAVYRDSQLETRKPKQALFDCAPYMIIVTVITIMTMLMIVNNNNSNNANDIRLQNKGVILLVELDL